MSDWQEYLTEGERKRLRWGAGAGEFAYSLAEARKTIEAVRTYCKRGRSLGDDDVAQEVLAILEVKE